MLTDALDHLIVMHRDAHFGGSFDEMITYYEDEDHIGIHPEFELDRIKELAHIERSLNENLSTYLLDEEELELVALAKKSYIDFRTIYEIGQQENSQAKLIADLIFSETEEPVIELDNVVKKGPAIVDDLIRLLQWDEGYNSLFPGYGYAPYYAILALSYIKDERSIIPLFETFGRETIFGEEPLLSAFTRFGAPAKNFLLKVLISRPITNDNINAAVALSSFADQEIEKTALYELQNPETWKNPSFFTYLLFLANQDELKQLNLSSNPELPQNLKKEISDVLHQE